VSNTVIVTAKQLQAKFKHAVDFGIVGNYSNANATKFSVAILQHINSPDVKMVNGTFKGSPVIHYIDPNTGLNVMADLSANFMSGWKLNSEQLKNVLKHGGL
jgi:hypothetical protein